MVVEIETFQTDNQLVDSEPATPATSVVLVEAAPPTAPVDTSSTEALFGQLFEQYQDPIYQYVYRLMGDAEDARDFTQDAFTKAYKKLPATLKKGNFQAQAWLYRIARNVCLDELRHRKLVKWQPWESFASLYHPNQVSNDNPERDALQQEVRHEVQTVLDRLSPRYRAALILREYHGLGYEELGTFLGGISREAAKYLLRRARESFRLHYARAYPELAAEAKGPRVLPRILGRSALTR